MGKSQIQIQNIKKITNLLGKEGIVEILIFIQENNSARVRDLRKMIKSPTTLVRQLNKLTDIGVLNRNYLDKRHRLTEYTLTDFGRKIIAIIDKIENDFS